MDIMTIKLIATDMDGTLLDDQKELSKGALAAIETAKDQGIKVVLATGRPMKGVQSYLDQLNMAGKNQYVLTYNGAFVQNTAGDPVISHPLGYDDFLKFEKLADEYKMMLHFETMHHFYTTNTDLNRYIAMESFATDTPIRVRTAEQIRRDIVIGKIMITADPADMTEFKKQMDTKYFEDYQITMSEEFFLEINSNKASKGTSIGQLADKLGINHDEVMIFGDQGNDLSMFKQDEFVKVAMGNAIDDLKSRADYVTKTNEEGGFAHAVRKFALND